MKTLFRFGLVVGIIVFSAFVVSSVDAQTASSIYEDSIISPWSANSFRGFYDYANMSQVFRGTAAIFASSSSWGGISFSTRGVPQSMAGKGYLEFSAYSKSSFRIYPLLFSKGKMSRPHRIVFFPASSGW